MEGIKEKGFFRKFIDWLNNADENSVDDDGEINEKAFKNVDSETLKELKNTSNNINKMAEMFKERISSKTVKNSLKEELEVESSNSKEDTKNIQKSSRNEGRGRE